MHIRSSDSAAHLYNFLAKSQVTGESSPFNSSFAATSGESLLIGISDRRPGGDEGWTRGLVDPSRRECEDEADEDLERGGCGFASGWLLVVRENTAGEKVGVWT